LLDLASHHVDLLHYLLGRSVEEVIARTSSGRAEADDAVVSLRLDSGLVVQSLFSLGAMDEDRIEIYGRAGKLTVDRYRDWSPVITDPARQWERFSGLKRSLRKMVHAPYAWRKFRSVGHEPSYREALLRFVAAAGGGDTVEIPSLEDGYRSLEVIEAAEESARTGRPIALTAPSTARPHRRS
jgi:predicted dehydrogenase